MSLNHDPENPDRLPGLIRRVADARSQGDLNDALTDLAIAARPILLPAVEHRLRSSRIGGPDGMLDEAEDILNDLLFKIAKKAGGFRGKTDASAGGWLKMIATNLIEDATKTPRRRLWLLKQRLVHNGYPLVHWQNSSEIENSEQEEPDHGSPEID